MLWDEWMWRIVYKVQRGFCSTAEAQIAPSSAGR
jgi:hypothetical protein